MNLPPSFASSNPYTDDNTTQGVFTLSFFVINIVPFSLPPFSPALHYRACVRTAARANLFAVLLRPAPTRDLLYDSPLLAFASILHAADLLSRLCIFTARKFEYTTRSTCVGPIEFFKIYRRNLNVELPRRRISYGVRFYLQRGSFGAKYRRIARGAAFKLSDELLQGQT